MRTLYMAIDLSLDIVLIKFHYGTNKASVGCMLRQPVKPHMMEF